MCGSQYKLNIQIKKHEHYFSYPQPIIKLKWLIFRRHFYGEYNQ